MSDTTHAFSHRERITVITGLMLGMFLSALDQTIVATALPRLSADLHGVAHLSWVISAYLLTSTAATPIYGKLSDLWGRKPMLQAAILIFVLASALCALATSMAQLIFFRGLQGLGGGGLIAMAHATIADVISPRERGRYQAWIAAVFAVASVIGPVLGGIFTDYLSWRWVFWINLPIGIGALAMAELALRRLVARRVRHPIDYPGALLIVAAVCCILVVTTMGGNELPWGSPEIAGLGAAALGLFVLAIRQERRAKEPILPPRLFRNPIFLAANLANLLTAVGMLGSIIFLPLFLQLVFALDAGSSGLMLIPLTATTVAGAITAGRLMARTGRYKVFPTVGTLLSAAALLGLAAVGPETPLWMAATVMAFSGFGTGFIMPVVLVAVQNSVEPRDLGSGTASISFFRSLGGSFGVALYGAVLLARLDSLVGALPGHGVLGDSPGVALLHAGNGAISLAPPALRPAMLAAMAGAFHDLFHLGAGIAFLTFLVVLALKEVPLKTTPGAAARAAPGGQFAD